jgi:hypothetical protein
MAEWLRPGPRWLDGAGLGRAALPGSGPAVASRFGALLLRAARVLLTFWRALINSYTDSCRLLTQFLTTKFTLKRLADTT